MADKTCKTCVHWDEEPDDHKDTCDLQIRACHHVAVTGEIKNRHLGRHDLCYAMSGISIGTGPDFGCIHHQSKDAPHAPNH